MRLLPAQLHENVPESIEAIVQQRASEHLPHVQLAEAQFDVGELVLLALLAGALELDPLARHVLGMRLDGLAELRALRQFGEIRIAREEEAKADAARIQEAAIRQAAGVVHREDRRVGSAALDHLARHGEGHARERESVTAVAVGWLRCGGVLRQERVGDAQRLAGGSGQLPLSSHRLTFARSRPLT